MIVDLLRNDLSRVCRPESVVVSELCRLESLGVRAASRLGRCAGNCATASEPLDLLRAAFPGGSITGRRKFARSRSSPSWSQQPAALIAERSVIWASTARWMRTLLIRTITAGRGWWQMPVGGGIVAQSEPAARIRRNLAQSRGTAALAGVIARRRIRYAGQLS